MYKVLIDNEILSWSNTEETALLSAILTLEANKAGTFVFSLAPNHPKYNAFVFRQSIIDVYQDADLIFEGVPVSEETNFDNVKTVTCEGELTFLNDTIQRPAKYTGQTVTSFLTALLSEHNADCDASKTFTLGTVTVNGGSALYRYTNYESTMSEIAEDLVENLGGYLRVRHSGGVRYLDYLASSPHTSSQIIKIGYNLLDLSKNYSSVDICTMLIPLGATIDGQEAVQGIDKHVDITSVNGGLDYLISTASATYGKIWRTVIWDGINDPSTLLSTATAYLTDAQWSNMVLEARAFDLGLARSDVEQFRLLDEIRVVSAPHGLDRYFLLTKLELNLNDPAQTMITLGEETFLPISAASAKTSAEVENQSTQMQVIATQHARDLLENATGGCVYFRYDPQGVLYEIDIMNTNDPLTATKMWRWNINGWGYSDDGGQTYTIAATMDGEIDANFIKTGTLDANRIAAGSITLGKLSTAVQNDIGGIQIENLMPNVYAQASSDGSPWTTNGLTFTVNADGSVTVTGANSSSSVVVYYLMGTSLSTPTGVFPVQIDPTKSYIFSGCPAGGSTSTYHVRVAYSNDGNTWSSFHSDTGSGASVPTNYKYVSANIRIAGNYSITGSLTFYPMLETGTVAHAYQRTNTVIDAGNILTGYINANRIDANSITISKLASDVTTPINTATTTATSAQTTANAALAGTPVVNLMPNVYYFQERYGSPWATSGLTFTANADGSVTVTGTNSSSSAVSCYLMASSITASYQVIPIRIDPTKKYFLSGCPSGGSTSTYWMRFYYGYDGSVWQASYNDTGDGVAVPTGKSYLYIRIMIGGNYACPVGGLTFKPMLVTGETAMDFQRNSTIIDGGHIVTGTLDATKVNVVNLSATNITTGTLTAIEINNGSGTFKVTSAGSMTATDGAIAGWTISSTKISSNSGNTYISSDTSDYAFKATNTVIAHNGDIHTTGHLQLNGSGYIDLNNTSATVKAFGTNIIEPASSAFVRFGYYGKNMIQFYNSTTGDGVYLVINGTTLKLKTSGTSPNMYIRAEVVS